MSKKSNIDKYGLIILSITRQEIEDFDHVQILQFLSMAKMNAKKYEGKLNFLVTGYDEDARELHEISEVKKYFDFLDRCFPYWFYFLTKRLPPKYSPIVVLISLLVPIRSVISKDSSIQTIDFDLDKLEEFFQIHFHYLNELTEELGISKSENFRISMEVRSNISFLL
jgi:hypothetical protein